MQEQSQVCQSPGSPGPFHHTQDLCASIQQQPGHAEAHGSLARSLALNLSPLAVRANTPDWGTLLELVSV